MGCMLCGHIHTAWTRKKVFASSEESKTFTTNSVTSSVENCDAGGCPHLEGIASLSASVSVDINVSSSRAKATDDETGDSQAGYI